MDITIRERLSRRQALGVAALAGGGLAAGLSLAPRRAAAQQTPMTFPQTPGTLTRLAEDVYVWNFNGYNSLIITSEEGTLVTEPSSQFNRQASALLKAVAAAVSMGAPVKYVVFSHDQARLKLPDHAPAPDMRSAA